MTHAGTTDPADIAVSRKRREMRIRWTDGHESAYPFDSYEQLRAMCPCSACRAAAAGSKGDSR